MDPITLPEPRFKSQLTQYIFDLEHLRDRKLKGSTPPWLFFDLKDIVHHLESLTSARIEGNRTTLMSVVESLIDGTAPAKGESQLELKNIQDAIKFIEENTNSSKINKLFVCELHKLVVKDLSLPPSGDGSRHPGIYRPENNHISNSEHTPPDHTQVPALMEELINFINEPNPPQDDLLKTAVVHHRFAAIHPFDNGNGRTARLLTYAMLTRQAFIDDRGFRLLNPSAVFCMDRQKYYDTLALADKGGDDNMLQWCEYVLAGIKTEIEKIDKLLDVNFAKENIIAPALKLAREKKQLSDVEYEIMLIAMDKWMFQAKDVEPLFPNTPSRRTAIWRTLQRMKEQNFIMPHPNYKQKYVPRFSNNYLLRGVMQQLDVHDLLPVKPNE